MDFPEFWCIVKASLEARMSDETMLQAGMTAPDFTLTSATGEPITLSSYRGKKHVLLFFMREFL
jgi:cytochrome oxidase Cu insertion factor (SCO1/SenC/PrrC family)